MDRDYQFHTKLNPKLWQGKKLKPEARLSLLRAAMAFYDFLDIPGLKLTDIVLTGSNASYNYTDYSDCDVHLILDTSQLLDRALSENLFRTKKTLWGATYSATCKTYPIELYVEPTDEPAITNGSYSLLHGAWVKRPIASAPAVDDQAVSSKMEGWIHAIKKLLRGDPDLKAIRRMMLKLRRMRSAGLDQGGEFSVENLVYKGLRNRGLLQALQQAKVKATDALITVETAPTV